MHPSKRLRPSLLAAVLSIAAAAVASPLEARAQCPTDDVVSGLKSPNKIAVSAKEDIFVAESGDGTNTGRVSIVGTDGVRRTVVSGLPSGQAPEGEISGPTGIALRGMFVLVAIGEGDEVVAGPYPNSTVPNPHPSSPIFSSLLAISLSSTAKANTTGITLTPADHAALKAGAVIERTDAQGNKIIVALVADFPDYTLEQSVQQPLSVRPSNPYAVAADSRYAYVADASQDTISKVDLVTRQVSTLATLPKVVNPLPFGPPVTDAVPDGICLYGDSLLVTQLTGFPFPAGAAKVYRINRTTGATSVFIDGLTAAIDVVPVGLGVEGQRTGSYSDHFYVLEYSSDFLAGAPGRLLYFATPTSTPVVVNDCMEAPTGLALSAKRGFVASEIFAGKLVAAADY